MPEADDEVLPDLLWRGEEVDLIRQGAWTGRRRPEQNAAHYPRQLKGQILLFSQGKKMKIRWIPEDLLS